MSLKLLEYFDYSRKKSILHYVDPRGKLLLVFSLTCITILFNGLIPLLMVLITILPLIFMANFFKRWIISLLYMLPLLLLILILNSLLLQIENPTTIALSLIIRLIILSGVFGLYFQTVSPDDVSQMLIKFKFPYSFSWAVSTAYRFVPTLAKETTIIIDAQKSRGLQIDRGNFFKRIRNMIPLLIPIFASALRRSWQLAEAIESRGWNATKNRTFLYSLKLSWWDYFVIIISLAIFGVFLWLAITDIQFPYWMEIYIPAKYELKRLLVIAWNWFISLFSR